MSEALNLVGQRFGKLVVLSRTENNKKGNTQWLCKCDCGRMKIALGYDLTHGRTTTCGCKSLGRPSHKRQNLCGKRFGKLTVDSLYLADGKQLLWKCNCDCGNTRIATSNYLKHAQNASCGCGKNKDLPKNDLTGKTFGRVTVESFSHKENGKWYWNCICKCGNRKVIAGINLQNGSTKSCGCLSKESSHIGYFRTHGDSTQNSKYHRLYTEWRSMINRCSPSYHIHERYYDRGISVCEEWKKYEPFKEWALANGYSNELTLDRADNDGNYEPSNCRWATLKQQANNTSQNVYITYQGKTQTMKQWCEELNLDYGMVKARHRKGWDIPLLLSPPMK